jgi:hypothetical protein
MSLQARRSTNAEQHPDKESTMTAQLITLTHGDTLISSSNSGLILQVLTGLVGVAPANAPAADFTPALGEYWPGQGGIYGGKMQTRDGQPEYHLIFAAEDIGEHAWGGRGTESGATSKWDGMRNTEQLLSEGDRPAAAVAAKYSADGHHDFYLPAAAELYEAWLNIPERFAKDTWYWSSSQRSANHAFSLHFGVGYQSSYGKTIELRVRPVRRFIR